MAKHLPHGTAAAAKAAATTAGDSVMGTQIFQIHFKPNENVFFSGTDPMSLLEELGDLGECEVKADLSALPPLGALSPEQCYLARNIQLISEQPISKVKEVFLFVEDESEIRIECKSLNADETSEDNEDDTFRFFCDGVNKSIEALNVFIPQIQEAGKTSETVLKNCLRTLKILLTSAQHQECADLKGIVESEGRNRNPVNWPV